MRTSVDKVRDVAVDAIEAARDQASDLVAVGASRLASGIDARADRLTSGLDLVVEHTPVVSVELPKHRSGRSWKIALVLLVVGAVAFAVARRASAKDAPAAADGSRD